MKSKFISFMLAIFSVFIILGHKVSADTISIVSDTAYAPFEFKDTDQEYKGIDVDIIAKVAEISKWDYKMDFPGFDAAVNSVQAGQADAIMAGMSVTEARKKVFTFSDPYYDTKIVIVTRKSDKITAYDELKGKVVGVKNGTAAQTFLVENQDKYGYTLKVFDTNDLMYNSLGTGALDAVMDDKPVVQYAISQGQDLRIEMEGENVGSFAFAVKKGSKHEYLIDDFNKALAQMKADGSYQAIIDKWTADSEPAQATPVKDTYTIVSDSAFAPFEYQNEAGDYVGIDMDLIQAIADQQGFNIKISNPGFDAALNSVQAGQADAVIAGMSITDARKEIFDFSESYYTSNILLAVKAGSGITSYADLNGKVVGAKTGTASYNFFEENQDKYGYTIKTFDEATGMYDSLNTGAIDALMDDEAILLYAIQQGRDFETPVLGEPSGDYGFAVKKGNNPELIEMFNNGLAALKADGTYDEIVAQYLGETIANAKATPVKDSYTIVSDSAFAPFEYQDDAGNYVGIDMELIQAIADQQGFNITITNPGFDASLNSVQAGQADAVIAGMSITDARKEIFDFSTSYYTSNILLAVKSGSDISSYEDLKGKTVGAKTGTASYNFFEENQDKYGYTIKTFDEATGMYDSLNSGAIDALMDDEAILRYAIQQGRNFDTPIAGEPSGDYGFAVKKGSNPELIEMFNYGLAALKADGTYDAILAKYLGETENETSTATKTVDETTIAGLISNNYKQLLAGLGRTLSLAIISFALATVVGIIFGLMAVSPVKALRVISSIFVDVVRGIPLMIVAAFIFWGVPNFIESITGQQSPINDFVAGVIALTLNGGAYIAEIVRGGIQAVPVGQMEASRTLGVPYNKTMSKIILPQAFKLMLPSFINQFVISLKDTTIISAIGLVELFQTGKIIIARNYQSFRMYAILAVMYLVIITLLTRLAKRLEKRS